jgi:T5SS/PEP-CTERM-associated repeat protein
MKSGIFRFVDVLGCKAAIFPIALVFFFSPQGVRAQTIWTNASGDWFNPANWSIGVPNSSTDGEINNNGTARIALTGAATASLYLGFGPIDSGNLLVSGSGTLTSSFLAVGSSGAGTVTVQSGGTLSNTSANIANVPGSNGAVLVEDPGSSWTMDYLFNVGYSGAGALTIRNGGTVSSRYGFVGTNSGSNGVVLIDGAGSVWTTSSSGISIGGEGTGILTIQNGGAAKVGSIGGYFGRGVVLVNGAGSTITNSYRLIVGDSSGGSGTLTIQNGAAVSDVEGYIGWFFGSTGTVLVDGAGSTWTNSASLELLVGSLTIQKEGAVFAGSGNFGGSVVVDGLGSTLSNTQHLQISGILTVQNGGAVSSDGGSINGGTVLIDGVGSDWDARSQFQ